MVPSRSSKIPRWLLRNSKHPSFFRIGLRIEAGKSVVASMGLRRHSKRGSLYEKGVAQCALTRSMVSWAECYSEISGCKLLNSADGLPDIGHACGHNLIATSSIASAIGVEAVVKSQNLAGTIIVMGTPAEESGGGKWIMARHGAWRGVDVCVMTHGMANFSTPLCITKASWKLKARFRGKTAHAAAAPWTGRNACDAIVQAYSGIALLRQQIQKSESIQGCILEAGKASNLIPDYAEGSFSVRAPTIKQANALKARVEPIFRGAADATGCIVDLDW